MNNDGRIVAESQAVASDPDEVLSMALAFWPEAARHAGLPETGVRFRELQVHSGKRHRSCVVKVSTPNGEHYVLRAEFEESNAGRFLNYIERHKAAAKALGPVPGVSAPDILWQSPGQPVMVMEFAVGDTAFRGLTMAEYGLGERKAVVRRIGEAVSELHRVSQTGESRFWPKTYLNRVSRTADAVREGRLSVVKPKRFLGLCAYLQRAGKRARGHAFAGAVEHGDLHFRNILLLDRDVSFIDFSNHDAVFWQRDLANLWLANCPDHLAKEGQEPGYGLVAKADWSAFEEGYGTEVTSDPVFRFFFALRLFKVWLLVSARSSLPDRKTRETTEAVEQVFLALLADEAD